MIQAILNDISRNVEIKDSQIVLDGEVRDFDLQVIENQKFFHVLYQKQSYYFEVVSFDKDTKLYTIAYKGHKYEINIKDRFDLLLSSMGLDAVSKPKVNDVKAPMPGLVLSVKVQEGMEVKKGDPILILEAMKMENIIKSPVDGIVKSIAVKEKQAVDKNQTLINF
jgi:acetyl/propionyl-CoA carboxylase alpha subunit